MLEWVGPVSIVGGTAAPTPAVVIGTPPLPTYFPTTTSPAMASNATGGKAPPVTGSTRTTTPLLVAMAMPVRAASALPDSLVPLTVLPVSPSPPSHPPACRRPRT